MIYITTSCALSSPEDAKALRKAYCFYPEMRYTAIFSEIEVIYPSSVSLHTLFLAPWHPSGASEFYALGTKKSVCSETAPS